jgi:serine/threonine-protein kinase
MTPERHQQIGQLFHAALELDGSHRAAFLEQACTGDEELRREVESLIAAHERAGSFMKMSAIEVAAKQLAGTQAESLIGQYIGHYKIESVLGTGGMGEVYTATDRLGRTVALKLLPAFFTGDSQSVGRFRQEAQAVLALNHPNIVTIYDTGEADSTHYIASELIEGETLRQRMSGGALLLSEALEIGVQVASALAAAHEKGIVHCDIKPENVMLRPDGYAKVLDFGIAKLIERQTPAAWTQVTRLPNVETEPEMVIGTVQYMSPEQASGLQVDERTDIWSLGVLLYEMTAGRAPFEGDTPQDVLASILEGRPPPLVRYRPEIPETLEGIITKALRKDKEERYQTVKEMRTDLESLKKRLEFEAEQERSLSPDVIGRDKWAMSGKQRAFASTQEPIISTSGAAAAMHTTSSAAYLATEVKKHWRALTTVLSVLLLAALGLSYWFFYTSPITSIAVMPFVNESGNSNLEYLSDGMTESLINSLSRLPNLSVKARSSVFRYKGKGVESLKVAADLSAQAILNGRLVQNGNDLVLYLSLIDARNGNQIWGDEYNLKLTDLVSLQKEIAYDVSNKLQARLSGVDKQKVTKDHTQNTEALDSYLWGRFFWNKRTLQDLKKSIDYFDNAIALDPNYALAYSGLADAYALRANSGEPPHEMMPKAREAAQKALSLDDNLAEAHTALGQILAYYYYDFAGAEREYKRAIEIKPNYQTAHQWHGEQLSALGRHEEAIAEMRWALEIDPVSLSSNRMYGLILIFARKYDEAIAQLEKTLELDANDPVTRLYISLAYRLKGDYAASIEERVKYEELMGDHQSAVLVRKSFAKAGWRGFLQAMTGESRPSKLSLYNVASFHVELGEKDQAFDELNKSYENRESLIAALNVDPRFDPLRADPRFTVLVRRLSLSP